MVEPVRYQVVRAGQAEKIVRHSRFVGYASFCADDAAVADRRAQLERDHPRATHHVYAWRRYETRLRRESHGFDDAGEPGGTAGRPVLAALEAKNIVNALCVVIRYFGGIKLGAGGLVRAYGQTAALAIQAAELQPLEVKAHVRIAVDFADLAPLETLIARENVVVLERLFTPGPILRLALPESQQAAFLQRIQDLTAGRASVSVEGEDD